MHSKGHFDVLKEWKFKRQSIFFLLKIIATLIILWALAHNSQLKFELFNSIFYQPLYAVAIVVLIFFTVLTNAWRWHRLNAAQGITLPFSSTVIATYVGIAFNNVLPGSVGGDFVRCYYVMKRFPDKKSGAVLSTFLDRVCGLMGIIVIISTIAIYRYDIFKHNLSLSYLIRICFGLTMMGIIIFSILMLLPKRISISQWLRERFAHYRWFKPVLSILEAVSVYRKSKRILLESLVASIVTQLLILATIMVINQMMGLPDISAYIYMIALAIAQIANLIPLTPGGIGIGEAAFANVILLFSPGIIGAYATVFFAFRLFITVTYLPGVIWGIFGFKLLKNYQRRVSYESE